MNCTIRRSGWGGLGIYLAKAVDANVTGVTLSTEQLKISNERALREGLQQTVRFQHKDYRELDGQFDRIVSVGMLEHVGVNHYATYFRKIAQLLTDDGVALVHTIGRQGPADCDRPFIAKYIFFPGGYFPALSEISLAIERAGLIVVDIEILRLHYAKTLRAWRERFLANWEKAAAIRDEGLAVFQVQLVKRVEALPITRDYMIADEQRLLEQDVMDAHPRLVGE